MPVGLRSCGPSPARARWSDIRGSACIFAGQLIAVSRQRLVDLVQLAAELVADHRIPARARDRGWMSGKVLTSCESPQLAERDPQIADVPAELGRQRQLAHPPTQAVDQVAVGVGGHQPGAREDRDHQHQQPQPEQQLPSNRPLRQHRRPPCRAIPPEKRGTGPVCAKHPKGRCAANRACPLFPPCPLGRRSVSEEAAPGQGETGELLEFAPRKG